MTGVEGYVESAASGLLAGINAAHLVKHQPLMTAPVTSSLGSMAHYITHADRKHFQPMNANFGIFPELSEHIRAKKRAKKLMPNELYVILINSLAKSTRSTKLYLFLKRLPQLC
jgi:NAD(FAD)-utilizing enzyme possibly involved in translation